jgi:hypothetical protein
MAKRLKDKDIDREVYETEISDDVSCMDELDEFIESLSNNKFSQN